MNLVCDLCNDPWDGRTPAWTYVTVNTIDGPNAPGQNGFWCEDPEWLVCVVCHGLIQADNWPALYLRSVEVQDTQRLNALGAPLTYMQKVEISKTHHNFRHNRSPEPPQREGIRLEVIDP